MSYKLISFALFFLLQYFDQTFPSIYLPTRLSDTNEDWKYGSQRRHACCDDKTWSVSINSIALTVSLLMSHHKFLVWFDFIFFFLPYISRPETSQTACQTISGKWCRLMRKSNYWILLLREKVLSLQISKKCFRFFIVYYCRIFLMLWCIVNDVMLL